MGLGPRVTFANLAGSLVGSSDIISIARFAQEQYDFSVDWSQIDWCRARWKGKLVLKGILTPDDARLAVEHGADALIVSNHGGRQVDGAPSAIAVLPLIAATVRGRAELILDGGVRRGTDILKALALGARACMAGRPFLYGLAAGGEPAWRVPSRSSATSWTWRWRCWGARASRTWTRRRWRVR